jgi:hypothetical protein
MIGRVEKRFGLYPEKLTADRAYGSAEMLGWHVHERGIEPHIPVFDKSARSDGTFEREDFTYDRESDVYFCPAGKMLTCKGTLVNDGATLMYRASKYDCDPCTLKPRCSPNAPARKIPRAIHEGARNMARDIAKDRCLSDLTTRTEEDRYAVRPPQTHPATRETAIARGRTARVTSSTSQPQPRTSES